MTTILTQGDVPFSGNVTGTEQGSLKGGMREGTWVTYYDNGQLYNKRSYKSDVAEGIAISYHSNGKLKTRVVFNNGKQEGPWEGYSDKGHLETKIETKNGELYYETYYKNGQLKTKDVSGKDMRRRISEYYTEDGQKYEY